MDKCNFQRTCQPPIGAMNKSMKQVYLAERHHRKKSQIDKKLFLDP